MKIIAKAAGMRIVSKMAGHGTAHMIDLAKAGISNLLFDGGRGWEIDEGAIKAKYRGILNVMKHLGILAGSPEIPEKQVFVMRGNIVRAKSGGLFTPKVKPGQMVNKDQLLGLVTKFSEEKVERLVTPVEGIIIGIRLFAPLSTGNYVANIGTLALEEENSVEQISGRVNNQLCA